LSDLLPAALELAATGRAVFPLAPLSKNRPLTRWRHGGPGQRATTDPEVITRWWTRWPDANIGMPTGDGLVVVDIDPRSGGTPPAWLPDTAIVTTPSGGTHHYLAVPRDGTVKNSAGQLAPGVDVRADGGMVVAPPSRTTDGAYAWRDPAARIAPIDPILLTPPAQARSTAARGHYGPGFEPRTDGVGPGERNDYLARACGWLLASGNEHRVEQLLHAENREACRPPLPDDEVDRIIASITSLHARSR
jgi:hypothetical protein